jgi:hypothetical protein
MSLALTAELWQMDNQGSSSNSIDMKAYRNYSSEIDRRPAEVLTKEEKLARREVDPEAMRSILVSNKTPRTVASRGKGSILRSSVDASSNIPLPSIDQSAPSNRYCLTVSVAIRRYEMTVSHTILTISPTVS